MLKIKFLLFSFLFSSAVNASENNAETRFKSRLFRTCTKISSGVKQKTINTAVWLKNHKKPIAISAASTMGGFIYFLGFWNLYVTKNEEIIKGNDKNTFLESASGALFDGMSQLFKEIKNHNSFESLNEPLNKITDALDTFVKKYCTGYEGVYVAD